MGSEKEEDKRDGWITLGRIHIDRETETETFERAPPGGFPAPPKAIYTQAQMDEAIAKERERCCAAICDACANPKSYHAAARIEGSMRLWHESRDDGAHTQCDAAAIRNPLTGEENNQELG